MPGCPIVIAVKNCAAHTAERIAVIVKGHKDAALVFAGLDDDPNAGGCAKVLHITGLKAVVHQFGI